VVAVQVRYCSRVGGVKIICGVDVTVVRGDVDGKFEDPLSKQNRQPFLSCS
jgi:hypothetical protein